MVEGDGSKYTVKVTDLEGNPFTYVVVVIEVNGEKIQCNYKIMSVKLHFLLI